MGCAKLLGYGLGVCCGLLQACDDGNDPRVIDADRWRTSDGAAGAAALELLQGASLLSVDEFEALRSESCFSTMGPEPHDDVLFIVLDASSSMNDPPQQGGGRSKWELTCEALSRFVAAADDETQVGLLAYPNRQVSGTAGDSSQCVNVDALVPLGALGRNDHRQRLIDGLDAVELHACSPTHDAYRVALDQLASTAPDARKRMLLITDGQADLALGCEPGTCSDEAPADPQPLLDEIGAAHAESRTFTYVIGLPGSELDAASDDGRRWLSLAAEQGCTAPSNCSHDPTDDLPWCHLDLSESENLETALEAELARFAGWYGRCYSALPVPPAGISLDLTRLHVVIAAGDDRYFDVQRASDRDCTHGYYLQEDELLVTLCSRTCEIAQAGEHGVELLAPCTEETPAPPED